VANVIFPSYFLNLFREALRPHTWKLCVREQVEDLLMLGKIVKVFKMGFVDTLGKRRWIWAKD
jgi:hypothetical protein